MISKGIKDKLSQLFSTEEISKAIIAMGFKYTCFASHCGFKQFGEEDDKMQHKQIYFPGLEMWNELQQEYNMPFFNICQALTWQQITDWLRDEHDIDIDVTKIRHDPEFQFLFSVMIGGKVVDSSRTVGHFEAMEKAVKCAIEYKISNQ